MERELPTVPVKLAYGSCDLHINQYGTLLSVVPVSPIISVKALLRLGYRIDWNASRCRIYHPKFGELDVDTSTGCPEVDEEVALGLIDQYELYVGQHDTRGARLRCIIEDLRSKGTEDLVGLIGAGDSQADAAFSALIARMFPDVCAETLEQCVVSLQDSVEEPPTWNRMLGGCLMILQRRLGLTRVCFFQGPVGHRKRRPTCLGTNLEPDPVIVECGVPLSMIDYVERKDYGMLEELWSEWAPGLIQAMSSMLHRSFAMTRQETSVGGELRKIDPGFLHHLQQNHMPYRHDCVTCLKGSARRKQRRRVLTPQSWCLSVDTAGPFVKGRDEHTTKARYLIVGVLSVPILVLNGKEVDVPCDADEGPPVPEGGAIDDAEWLSDCVGAAEEPEPGLSTREVADARESWSEWDRLVKSSRKDWLCEAQSEKLPKVEIVDFVYVEAIERKRHGEVLTAIGRMHARAKAEGFDVRRLHSDRGREYNNKSLRDWCARHSVHKTLAVAEEHQGNGRAEGAIMRVKNLTRTILEESDGEKLDWPLAAKLAAHELKNAARRRLKIDVQQSLPFNTKVQIISRSWKRETWESRTTTALVKCPSADMSRGWVVATEDGKLMTTGKLFPSVDQGKVSFSSTGSAVDLDAPDYRIKGKTSIKQLQDEFWGFSQEAQVLTRSVALKCASIELQKLQKILCENESLDYLQASCDGEELVQLECVDATGARPEEQEEPPLQTKIIGADQVRREPEKWIPSMIEEYQSLVSKTGAVQELSDSQYKQLLEDPGVTLEIIPGKLVYVHKTSGRRKSRIVGCGNYCQGGSGERNELYASGAGAEPLRLMIRRCALRPEWVLASVDVRTAFLQAPLLEQERGGKRLVTIVRVPSILRETGVTACKFWRVQKALYGLASAPKSWSSYRDKVLAGLSIPCEGGVLRLSRMLEDANLLHIIKLPGEGGSNDSGEGQKLGVVALYVDDILIGAERSICEAVIKALQDQWELSPPEWLEATGDQMKFAGYELQKTSEGIRLHQESYVRDLLEQTEESIVGEERAPAVKMGSFDDVVDESDKRELTKRSQTLIGQLLWLAGRTRPDLAYGVSMAAQKIASSPKEALARAEHLVKYLRGAPGVGLHYKAADGGHGKWNQLRYSQTSTTLEVFTDASFAADEQCRSFGSVHLYWGGALVMWAASRQTLIAAHTAESELYSLSEGHLMGKALRPTVAALMSISEAEDIMEEYYAELRAAYVNAEDVPELIRVIQVNILKIPTQLCCLKNMCISQVLRGVTLRTFRLLVMEALQPGEQYALLDPMVGA
ncbi:RE1 [Symbiodinium microadriaticum]|nr:RE1 [Symbiodinium microadriaticum]CAE7330942.1 RE1 [Symbiodinium sp. KB8]